MGKRTEIYVSKTAECSRMSLLIFVDLLPNKLLLASDFQGSVDYWLGYSEIRSISESLFLYHRNRIHYYFSEYDARVVQLY